MMAAVRELESSHQTREQHGTSSMEVLPEIPTLPAGILGALWEAAHRVGIAPSISPPSSSMSSCISWVRVGDVTASG